jgi:hypothetical protein
MFQHPRDKAALPRRSPRPGGNRENLCERESVEGFCAQKPCALKMRLGAPARSALECGVKRRFVARENFKHSQTREAPGMPQGEPLWRAVGVAAAGKKLPETTVNFVVPKKSDP